MYWEPNWVEAPAKVFKQRVEAAIDVPEWVVDVNYGPVRDLLLRQADTVIWLDFSFPVIFGWALIRTIRRVMTQEELWSGNRESVRKSFLSKDSVLLWVMKTVRRRRRKYPELFARQEYSDLKVIRFHAP